MYFICCDYDMILYRRNNTASESQILKAVWRMQMKAIFLVEDQEKINSVYPKKIMDVFAQNFTLINIYSKKNVVEDPKSFHNVKYIFQHGVCLSFLNAKSKNYFLL